MQKTIEIIDRKWKKNGNAETNVKKIQEWEKIMNEITCWNTEFDRISTKKKEPLKSTPSEVWYRSPNIFGRKAQKSFRNRNNCRKLNICIYKFQNKIFLKVRTREISSKTKFYIIKHIIKESKSFSWKNCKKYIRNINLNDKQIH